MREDIQKWVDTFRFSDLKKVPYPDSNVLVVTMNTLKMAEAALSPKSAWVYMETPRKIWGYGKDPDESCKFLGRNPRVKSLIWC